MPGSWIKRVREPQRDVGYGYFYLLCEIMRNSNERKRSIERSYLWKCDLST